MQRLQWTRPERASDPTCPVEVWDRLEGPAKFLRTLAQQDRMPEEPEDRHGKEQRHRERGGGHFPGPGGKRSRSPPSGEKQTRRWSISAGVKTEATSIRGKEAAGFALNKDLLLPSRRCDWGMRAMRAIKFVLVVAGGFEREDPTLTEKAVLMRSLRDTNAAKITGEDLIWGAPTGRALGTCS